MGRPRRSVVECDVCRAPGMRVLRRRTAGIALDMARANRQSHCTRIDLETRSVVACLLHDVGVLGVDSGGDHISFPTMVPGCSAMVVHGPAAVRGCARWHSQRATVLLAHRHAVSLDVVATARLQRAAPHGDIAEGTVRWGNERLAAPWVWRQPSRPRYTLGIHLQCPQRGIAPCCRTDRTSLVSPSSGQDS